MRNGMVIRSRQTTEVRQQQITEAALQVIGIKGISGATTTEIASEAGISEGNLYRHFKNKEDIIGSVFDKIGTDLASILAAAPGNAEPIKKAGSNLQTASFLHRGKYRHPSHHLFRRGSGIE